jgi:hypothetical protein
MHRTSLSRLNFNYAHLLSQAKSAKAKSSKAKGDKVQIEARIYLVRLNMALRVSNPHLVVLLNHPISKTIHPTRAPSPRPTDTGPDDETSYPSLAPNRKPFKSK